MTTRLQTHFLYAGIDGDALLVGFADREFDTNEYLLLQKSLTCDQQDIEMGLDQVHISFGDPSRSAYGGIERFVLGDGKAVITLDPQTAHALQVDRCVEVEFPRGSDRLDTARQYLKRMFIEGPGEFVYEE